MIILLLGLVVLGLLISIYMHVLIFAIVKTADGDPINETMKEILDALKDRTWVYPSY